VCSVLAKKIAFFDETMFFLAHFHPFAVIISPFHAVGMQWGQNLPKNVF
jgi:hypothetical protein